MPAHEAYLQDTTLRLTVKGVHAPLTEHCTAAEIRRNPWLHETLRFSQAMGTVVFNYSSKLKQLCTNANIICWG
jgi:hypothetical protein